MKVLLIPSAILVPRQMRNSLGNIPQVLYPLNSKTMLEHICEKYKSVVEKIYVIGYEKYNFIEDFVKWKKLNVHVLKVPKLKELGDTILFGLESILRMEHHVEMVVINFADTLIEEQHENLLLSDAVFYDCMPMNAEWTFFECDKSGITKLWDKTEHLHTENTEKKVFVGVFSIQDPKKLHKLLEQEAISTKGTEDSFYRALKSYSADVSIKYSKVKAWFDVGHSENSFKALTGVKARNFNQINLDEERGILVKRSKAVDKFIGEIKWYLRMPEKLQYMLPRIYDYSLNYQDPYIRMEYYGYHTLHELLVYGDTPLLKWQVIFRRLHRAVSDMHSYTVNEKEYIQKSLENMYIDKTLQRMNMLRENNIFSSFFEKQITVNGKCYNDLNTFIEKLKIRVKRELIDTYQYSFTIIHGDLCFSNILVEDGYQFIRMIDPRGKFGEYDIYGDPRYEMAKIMHSLEGKYDYVIEDMFELEREQTNISYKVKGKTKAIEKIFLDEFHDMVTDRQEIRLIESLLFLSMIPLHSDYPNRQMIMLAIGLDLFYQ